jgi:hypothetical protein
MANGHGGHREGSGRKKGSKDKSTIERSKRLAEAMRGKTFENPLDFLTYLMNDETADFRDRKDAARILMPYFHKTADKSGVDTVENAKTITNSRLFSIINGEVERLN